MNEKLESWNRHYTREKSILLYPDENLVRMLKNYLNDHDNPNKLIAVDLGCGSGRHIKLIDELGISKIIGIDISYNALSICSERYNSFLLQAQGDAIPLKDNSIDIVGHGANLIKVRHLNGKVAICPPEHGGVSPTGGVIEQYGQDGDTVEEKNPSCHGCR